MQQQHTAHCFCVFFYIHSLSGSNDVLILWSFNDTIQLIMIYSIKFSIITNMSLKGCGRKRSQSYSSNINVLLHFRSRSPTDDLFSVSRLNRLGVSLRVVRPPPPPFSRSTVKVSMSSSVLTWFNHFYLQCDNFFQLGLR